MSKKIQDYDFSYDVAKNTVYHHIKKSFWRYQVVGLENIPDDGAVIYASNHANALIDPLTIITSTKIQKVYMMRADLFKNKRIGKILTWMKTMPIFRVRDGLQQVRENNAASINNAVAVAASGVPLGIFPEATHRTKHSLRQLTKGVFHIALEAYRQLGDTKPVYILPIGLEYGDYFRYRSTVLLSYGKPINVSEFVKAHPEDSEPVIINKLKEILTEKMSELISYLPDNEDYDAAWEFVKLRAGKQDGPLTRRFARNRDAINELRQMKQNEPTRAQTLLRKADEFRRKRTEAKISSHAVVRNPSFWRMVRRTFHVVCGLPFFILAAVANLPIWAVTAFVHSKIGDKAFLNTASFAIEMVMHPILMIVGIALLFSNLSWEMALAASVLLYPSYIFFVDYKEYFRRWMSDWRWLFNKELQADLRDFDKMFE